VAAACSYRRLISDQLLANAGLSTLILERLRPRELLANDKVLRWHGRPWSSHLRSSKGKLGRKGWGWSTARESLFWRLLRFGDSYDVLFQETCRNFDIFSLPTASRASVVQSPLVQSSKARNIFVDLVEIGWSDFGSKILMILLVVGMTGINST
jgi:hypothetical protein